MWLKAGEAERVAISQTVSTRSGRVAVKIVDCGRGGLGVESRVFLPKGAALEVRVLDPAGEEDGGTSPPVLLEGSLLVQRVRMIDREPTYYIGCAFAAGGPDLEQAIDRLIGQVQAPGEGAGGRA